MFLIYNNSGEKKTILINTTESHAEPAKIISIEPNSFSEPLSNDLFSAVNRQSNDWAIIFPGSVLEELEGKVEVSGERETKSVKTQEVNNKEGSEEQSDPKPKAKRGRKRKVQNS